jgi:hypothetical protein
MEHELDFLVSEMGNAIRPLIEKGAKALADEEVRAQVFTYLSTNTAFTRQDLFEMTNHEVIHRLTIAFIRDWPHVGFTWVCLRKHLPPFAAIEMQFDYERINRIVHVRDTCVIVDDRCQLAVFKNLLIQDIATCLH